MKIVVYTCNLNGWDNLHPPSPEATRESSAEYICYTNDTHAPAVDHWGYRPAYFPASQRDFWATMSWGRTARIPKMMPQLFFEADFSIWHDANFSLTMRPEDIVERTLVNPANGELYDIAVCKHPSERTSLYEEAAVCIEAKIGDTRAIARQVKEYELKGHPKGFGLWACGFIVRRHNLLTASLNNRWWQFFSEGGDRDQIAFPMALWNGTCDKNAIKLHTLPVNVYGSPYTQHHWHNAFKGRGDVDSYAESRKAAAMRAAELEAMVGPDRQIKVQA